MGLQSKNLLKTDLYEVYENGKINPVIHKEKFYLKKLKEIEEIPELKLKLKGVNKPVSRVSTARTENKRIMSGKLNT